MPAALGMALRRAMKVLLLGGLLLSVVPSAQADTLGDVRARQDLRCGVFPDDPGRSAIDKDGHWAGFYVDFCRALAAAVLGNPDYVTYVEVGPDTRFSSLVDKRTDVVMYSTTWTLGREAKFKVDFPAVYLFDGQGFMVRKQSGIRSFADLNGKSVCVTANTTTHANLLQLIRQRGYNTRVVLANGDAFFRGSCDAYTADAMNLAANRAHRADAPQAYDILSERFSREPIGPMVRDDDGRWSRVVGSVVNALILAEELGVTAENAKDLKADPSSELGSLLQGSPIFSGLGLEGPWAIRAVLAVGNYGQIYDRNFGPGTPIRSPVSLMMPLPSAQASVGPWYKRISFQLIALLCSLFVIAMTSVVLVAVILWHHEEAIQRLFSGRFEQAMAAGELARDAEVLNAQIFERMLSGRNSHVDGHPAIQNQMAIFKNSRDKLAALGGNEALADIDLLQADYFRRVQALEARFQTEDERELRRSAQTGELLEIIRALNDPKIVAGQPSLAGSMQMLAGRISSCLVVTAPGQIQALETSTKSLLETIRRARKGAGGELPTLSERLEQLSDQVFTQRNADLLEERVALAEAREMRVSAQRLAGAAYSHYLTLRQGLQAEMEQQAATVQRTLEAVAWFAGFAFLVSLAAVLYIVRHVGARLRQLNLSMTAHVSGQRIPIPVQGQDEIAEMGKAFQIFVSAHDQAEAEQAQHREMLAKAAITDSLSGLPNRRGFDEAFEREWRRCARAGLPLAIVMADIDFFKAYNDHYGHLLGDQCIALVSQVMRDAFNRAGDYPARYGGEEFVCILPDTDLAGANCVAERFRLAVENAGQPHEASSIAACVTVSVGVACVRPVQDGSAYALLNQADEALYRAKAAGRNQVVVTPEESAQAAAASGSKAATTDAPMPSSGSMA